ncbi:hypothetical protein GC163_06820 [bacterium]|nr:hypothetical protein [bacterium]
MPNRLRSLAGYLGHLSLNRLILWCYLLWYLTIVALYFEPRWNLWLSSVGMSAIIGFALVLSTTNGQHRPDRWTIMRLFLMPFCVSSYSAIIKGRGFWLIFPPVWWQILLAFGLCGAFVATCTLCRKSFRM